jgi:H+/gluconate symporter-like permease
MKPRAVATEILISIVPGVGIALALRNYSIPPPDLARTLLTLSAGTVSIFFAATSFLYGQFSDQVAKLHGEAAGKTQEQLKKMKEEELAPTFFPKAFVKVVLRCFVLALISFAISAVDYLTPSSFALFVSAAAILLFYLNVIGLMVMTLGRLSRRIARYEQYVEKRAKGEDR